jgi:hypothetical protein
MKLANLFWALMTAVVATDRVEAQAVSTVVDKVDWSQFLGRHDLVWESLPAAWDGGAFLGNGLLGAMVYSDKNCPMRWDIGRSDVTDHRGKPDESPNACFDRARLPIGHFVLESVGKPSAGQMRLNLWGAEATGSLTTDQGRIAWRSFVHASDMAIVVELQTTGKERDCQWKWVAEESKSTRTKGGPADYQPNPPSRIEKVGETNVCIQPLLVGGQYATAWQEVRLAADRRLLVISVGNSYPGQSAAKDAVDTVREAVTAGLDQLVASHRQWWHGYYPASFVSVPDTRLESFYWIQMYKLGSATRADRPAIDLMGPWFRTTGWPAIWWNLNIQLTYYPVYVSNRLELGESLCRMLDCNIENLILNVKKEYQHDSAAIGRVSGYDCRGSVGNEVGNLTWACHNYWRQYRYSMDDARLREKLLPLLRRCTNYYLHLLERGPDGKLHLPETFSPEYGVARDCNYDLSLLRWGCQTLLGACQRLKIDDPLIPKWQEVLEKLTDYPQGPDGLWIGRDQPLAHSHRHYSHLLMIYPLHLVNWEQPGSRDLITRSLDHWIGFEGALQGYSFTGSASISASIGRRNEAVGLLNTLLDRYVRPNTMYLEGSPVIETPLSGAESIHDLLIQSWGDKIRLFPGVPDAWKDVTFHKLRAEGAFLVSAVRRDGQTRWVRIESLAGEPCRVKADFTGPVQVLADRKIASKTLPDGTLELDLRRGEAAVLCSDRSQPQLVVDPVAAQPGRSNWYGSRKSIPIAPDADGQFDLTAAKATIHGEFLLYEKTKIKDDLGRWISGDDWASWVLDVSRPGSYTVKATYGSPSAGGRKLGLSVGPSQIAHEVRATGGFDKFQEFEVGSVTLQAKGPATFSARAIDAPKGLLINLQRVRLVPRR